MSKTKYVVFACMTLVLSTGLTVGLLLGLDLYLHKKFEKVAGLNIHGYRGPVVKRKQPNERRIVVLGGSTALGYGVAPQESFPAVLEKTLNERRRQEGGGPVSLVNLAYNTEGAYAYLFNLRSYKYLDYDVALFYTGFNDLGGLNTYVYRNTSPIFRLTGYMPIIPLIFQEKAMALRYGGDLEAAYRGHKTVFKPNLAERATASALEAAVKISQSLERQIGRLTKEPPIEEPPPSMDCGETWQHYCRSIYVAVEYALSRDRHAVVVTEPYVSDPHVEQQRAMVGMLKAKFGDHPRLRHLDLGRAVDLHDPRLCYDGLHLTAEGNEQIASLLVEPIMEILR